MIDGINYLINSVAVTSPYKFCCSITYLDEEISSFEVLISSLLVLDDPEDTFSDCLPFLDSPLRPDLETLCSVGNSFRLDEFCFLKDEAIFSFLSAFDFGDRQSVLFLDFETDCDQSAVDVAKPGKRWSKELLD